MSTMADTVSGGWNTTSAMNMIGQISEVAALKWDVAIGMYHFLLLYVLNKFGLRIWLRISGRSDQSISWWKSNGQPTVRPVDEDEVLHRKLDVLAEKGWGGDQLERGPDSSPSAAMAMTEEEDVDDVGPPGMPISHSVSCRLVLAFQCVLSDEQIYEWADKMRNMFGSSPRVERFERSTIVHTSVWTHEALLHDAAAIVREACDHPQGTLQIGSWGVFLCGVSAEGGVELVKLQGLDVPVIVSANQTSGSTLEIRGLHLNEADLIAQTHDQSMRLLSNSSLSRDMEEVEALSVQCPPDALHQDLHVYASKTVVVNGSLISVQCATAKVVSMNDNVSTSTESITWILAALIVAVPMTEIGLSLLYPSSGSSLVIVVGQGLGWILGWLTQQLLTASARFLLGEHASIQKLGVGWNWEWEWERCLVHVRQGSCLFLLLLVMLLCHWWWTHMGPVQKKWLLVGATTAAILVAILELHAKLRKSKEADIVSRSRYWKNMMSTAVTYSEWKHAASMLHLESGRHDSKFYDEAHIQGKLRELQLRRIESTTDAILLFLRTDLIRHPGNMCNPGLHKHRGDITLPFTLFLSVTKRAQKSRHSRAWMHMGEAVSHSSKL